MTLQGVLRSTPARALSALGALLATLAITPVAAAYCRTSTCPPDLELGTQGAQCTPHQDGDCGVPLAWLRDCTGFAVQKSASKEIALSVARATLAQAFKTWESVDCGGGNPGIHVVDLGTVDCDEVEYEPRAGNANILIFRDEVWQENGYDKLALTTVNFDKETGDIWNADIEVNTHDYDFQQGKSGGDYDLVGVLTHEAGHFLGLAHSDDPDATMYSVYFDGMADLSEDDGLAICDAYPPKPIDKNHCDPIPRHGFSPRCAADQTEGKCAVEPLEEGPIPGDIPVIPVATVAVLFTLRRRRSER
ncbi:MAG: matrixin family metalloprotease [Polyangiaceae bacterium]